MHERSGLYDIAFSQRSPIRAQSRLAPNGFRPVDRNDGSPTRKRGFRPFGGRNGHPFFATLAYASGFNRKKASNNNVNVLKPLYRLVLGRP